MKTQVGHTELSLDQGDITRHTADAIVNAANSSLLGGGGVDGAIHRAGGPAILEECKRIRADKKEGCPPGNAVITTAGKLPAEKVIHTVGPIWRGGHQGEPAILASCYTSSLSLAMEYGLKSVAFPSVSTGVYGYPVRDAARVALGVVRDFIESHPNAFDRVTWVLFDDTTFRAYEAALTI
ncbi:MAG: O-acetyl-ADP-ribose deacetylase [Deltaproteobacteria bacterium]|nr:O-acetyl-ADP-ribose deacetylase [Deltaproteobacteria bacterium]